MTEDLGPMRVSSVSERGQRWEIPFPTYRVYFWENPVGHPVMWTSYPYEITGAHNVQQVLAWAEANARGRTYQVFVVRDEPEHGLGLISLSGSAPTHRDDPRARPPKDLQAHAELDHVERLYERRDAAEERIRDWLRRDDEERKS